MYFSITLINIIMILKILEMLTGHCSGVANTKENGLVATKVYLDDLADELVNLFATHNFRKF